MNITEQTLKYEQEKQEIQENSRSYIIHLLLNDGIRDNHKKKFQHWIARTDDADALSLGRQIQDIVEHIANDLGSAKASSNLTAWHKITS